MKMRSEANGAGLRSDTSMHSEGSRWTTKKSQYVSQLKSMVNSKIRVIENAGVEEFR